MWNSYREFLQEHGRDHHPVGSAVILLAVACILFLLLA
jgi:hypothetical protein